MKKNIIGFLLVISLISNLLPITLVNAETQSSTINIGVLTFLKTKGVQTSEAYLDMNSCGDAIKENNIKFPNFSRKGCYFNNSTSNYFYLLYDKNLEETVNSKLNISSNTSSSNYSQSKTIEAVRMEGPNTNTSSESDKEYSSYVSKYKNSLDKVINSTKNKKNDYTTSTEYVSFLETLNNKILALKTKHSKTKGFGDLMDYLSDGIISIKTQALDSVNEENIDNILSSEFGLNKNQGNSGSTNNPSNTNTGSSNLGPTTNTNTNNNQINKSSTPIDMTSPEFTKSALELWISRGAKCDTPYTIRTPISVSDVSCSIESDLNKLGNDICRRTDHLQRTGNTLENTARWINKGSAFGLLNILSSESSQASCTNGKIYYSCKSEVVKCDPYSLTNNVTPRPSDTNTNATLTSIKTNGCASQYYTRKDGVKVYIQETDNNESGQIGGVNISCNSGKLTINDPTINTNINTNTNININECKGYWDKQGGDIFLNLKSDHSKVTDGTFSLSNNNDCLNLCLSYGGNSNDRKVCEFNGEIIKISTYNQKKCDIYKNNSNGTIVGLESSLNTKLYCEDKCKKADSSFMCKWGDDILRQGIVSGTTSNLVGTNINNTLTPRQQTIIDLFKTLFDKNLDINNPGVQYWDKSNVATNDLKQALVNGAQGTDREKACSKGNKPDRVWLCDSDVRDYIKGKTFLAVANAIVSYETQGYDKNDLRNKVAKSLGIRRLDVDNYIKDKFGK